MSDRFQAMECDRQGQFGDGEDFNCSDGVPADMTVVAEAFEDNNFWLPVEIAPLVNDRKRPAIDQATSITSIIASSADKLMSSQCDVASRDVEVEYSPPKRMRELNEDERSFSPIPITFQSSSEDLESCFENDTPLPSLQCTGSSTWNALLLQGNHGQTAFCTAPEELYTHDSGNCTLSHQLYHYHYAPVDPLVPTPFLSPPPAASVGETPISSPVPSDKVCASAEPKPVISIKAQPVAASVPLVKALTAYNFFFRFERNRILKMDQCDNTKGISKDETKMLEHHKWTTENTLEFQRQVLEDQWSRDPTIKRKHCKTHGCISFADLSKRISTGWHDLPVATKDVFRMIAAKDSKRYAQEVANAKEPL